MLAEDLRLLEGPENLHITRQDKRKKKKKERQKGIRTGPAPLGGSCAEGKFPAPWEVPLSAGGPAWMEAELWSPGEERSNQPAEGKMDSDRHRRSVPLPCAPQPETLSCRFGEAGRWVLKLRLQRQSQGEDRGWLCEDTLKRLQNGN